MQEQEEMQKGSVPPQVCIQVQVMCRIHMKLFFFFFLISNKDLLISKKETPKYIGSIQGCTYQIQKLHKSSKSKIEEKCWFLRTENQSNKVLKNRNLRSSIERSLSSKHRLFLSFQIHHIKQ